MLPNPAFIQLLAQADDASARGAAGGLAALFSTCCCFGVFWLIIMVFVVLGLWKMFVKADQPGWAAIVPIYNAIVILQIVGRPIWWIILLLIPGVSIVVGIIVCIDLAKSFGKGVGYGVGLVLLPMVFAPMLGFGKATYQGPSVVPLQP